jgi:hypothetical protein
VACVRFCCHDSDSHWKPSCQTSVGQLRVQLSVATLTRGHGAAVGHTQHACSFVQVWFAKLELGEDQISALNLAINLCEWIVNPKHAQFFTPNVYRCRDPGQACILVVTWCPGWVKGVKALLNEAQEQEPLGPTSCRDLGKRVSWNLLGLYIYIMTYIYIIIYYIILYM